MTSLVIRIKCGPKAERAIFLNVSILCVADLLSRFFKASSSMSIGFVGRETPTLAKQLKILQVSFKLSKATLCDEMGE